MNKITCPKCKEDFKIDDAGFADILKQVRDHQFEKELADRLTIAKKEKEDAVKIAEANMKNALQVDLAKKDKELTELKAEKELELVELLTKKESEIAGMKSKMDSTETEKKLAVTEAVNSVEKRAR